MDFLQDIKEFVSDKIGGVCIIAVGSGEVVYADDFYTRKYGKDMVGAESDDVFFWLPECPELKIGEKATEWEYIDMDTKTYYKIMSALFEKENKTYSIHQMTDITEYMGLNKDITKYMSFFKKLSAFQNEVLTKLSDSYYELLPMLANYFKTNKTYLFVQREDKIEMVSYNTMGKQYSTDRVDLSECDMIFNVDDQDQLLNDNLPQQIKEVLINNGVKMDGSIQLLTRGVIYDQKFAVYLNVWPNLDAESLREAMLKNVINLYIENGIMREKLVYESEHDQLTGLYNKGKYLDMMENKYKDLDSIGIFNMDVNYLKQMNDNYGHAAGDKLLIKAADSIRKVTSSRVHGYRVGGDEYMMIVMNPTKDEVDEIKARWEKELTRLNTLDDNIECIIAVGVVYAEKEYDLPTILKQADELMYEDKKRKKKEGEEIR